jgi:8-oxo-dGTP pyrophosphatase MutT (NUDIX family)
VSSTAACIQLNRAEGNMEPTRAKVASRGVTSPPGDYTATLPRKRMGSAVLLRDAGGRILLVEPAYKDYWELPGGAVEADESPYDAAVRELKEELGLSVTPGRLLVVDWVPPRLGRTEGIMFVYDGGVLDPVEAPEIHIPADELRSWAWSTPDEAQRRLSALLAQRAAAALQAASGGGTVYLENGNRIV